MNFSYYNVIYDSVHSTIMLSLGSCKNVSDAKDYIYRQFQRVLYSNANWNIVCEVLRAIEDAVIDYNKISGRNIIF